MGGTIGVRAWRNNGSLMVDVSDSGPGVNEGDDPFGEGVGMTNTRDRLRQLYGAGAGMRLFNAPSGGAVCRFWVPYREDEQARESHGSE